MHDHHDTFAEGAHEHTHEHTHDHDHPHTHPHDHSHDHGCAGSCGSCQGGCEHTPMEELTALMKYMVGHNAAHAKELGIDFGRLERDILLSTVDRHWMAHISNMDILRRGIGLRGYGQRDPFVEYRREGFEMFDAMIEEIQEFTAVRLARIDPDQIIEAVKMRQQQLERARAVRFVSTQKTDKKPGRNDPCPCGSGKKYKNCCGK